MKQPNGGARLRTSEDIPDPPCLVALRGAARFLFDGGFDLPAGPSHRTPGAALRVARRAKERIHPELLRSPRCRLVVIALQSGALLSCATPGFSSLVSGRGCIARGAQVCLMAAKRAPIREEACEKVRQGQLADRSSLLLVGTRVVCW